MRTQITASSGTIGLQVGNTFAVGRVDCTITKISEFSGEPHYGFTFVEDRKPGEAPRFGCGWMPVYLVDNFTGYHNLPIKEAK